MGNIIVWCGFSVVMIIGGLSGKLVLKGTNSSAALVVVGIGLLVWNISKLVSYRKREAELAAEKAKSQQIQQSQQSQQLEAETSSSADQN